jgi:hypothetical protein
VTGEREEKLTHYMALLRRFTNYQLLIPEGGLHIPETFGSGQFFISGVWKMTLQDYE